MKNITTPRQLFLSAIAVSAGIIASSGSALGQPTLDAVANTSINEPVEGSKHNGLAKMSMVNAYELITLDLEQIDAPAHFEFEVLLGDNPVIIELSQFSVRTDDYKAYIEMGNGVSLEVDPGPVRTYRGTVVGQPASIVSASLAPGGRLTARIAVSADELWHIEDVSSVGEGLHILFRDEDKEPLPPHFCGVPDDNTPPTEQTGSTPGYGTRSNAQVQARLTMEGDYEWGQEWGGSAHAEMEGIVNDMNVIYEGWTSITHRIAVSRVWGENNDPYTNDNSDTILDQFSWRSYDHFPEYRHAAMLWSDKNFDGSTIGLAWLGGMLVCGQATVDNAAQGGPVPENVPAGWTNKWRAANINEGILIRSRRVELGAHELGHNWNAPHCDGDPSCGIMLSTATEWPFPGRTSFGATSAGQITGRRDALSACFRAGNFDSNNSSCTGYCAHDSVRNLHDWSAPGSTVRVFPRGRAVGGTGTYNEQFLMNRPMTFTAPSGPVTVGR